MFPSQYLCFDWGSHYIKRLHYRSLWSYVVSTKTFSRCQSKQQTCMFSSLTHSSDVFYFLWPPLECQTFVFAVWLSGVATIKATVFDRNMARSHDILCSVEVLSSFDQFPLNQTKASWNAMRYTDISRLYDCVQLPGPSDFFNLTSTGNKTHKMTSKEIKWSANGDLCSSLLLLYAPKNTQLSYMCVL